MPEQMLWDKTGHLLKATCFSLQRADTGWATTHLLEWDVWLPTTSIPDPCPCCSWAQEWGLPRRYWSFPACCLAPEELGGDFWSGTLLEFISSDIFFAVDMIWELLHLGCYLGPSQNFPKALGRGPVTTQAFLPSMSSCKSQELYLNAS